MNVRAGRIALGAGVVGVALGLVEARLDPKRALFAYAAAFEAALAVAVGALLFLVIAETVRARWFVPFRRLTGAIAATLPLFLVLFLPLALNLGRLYPWAQGSAGASLDADGRAWSEHARLWLNPPFFVARAYVYLGVWSALAIFLRRTSLAGDTAPSVRLVERERLWSAIAIPLLAATLTLAAFDWVMSLDARWASDMMGVYVFAGAFSGAMGATSIAAWLAWRAGVLPREVGPAHFHALGRVLFVSVIFWAYIAFCQFVLVWIADLDRESIFYAERVRAGWGFITLALGLVHFAIPFLLLLSRPLKRTPHLVAAVGACVLAGHAIDAAWLVIPAAQEGVSVLDLGFVVGVGGLVAAFAASRFAAVPPVPRHHPALTEGLRYESP